MELTITTEDILNNDDEFDICENAYTILSVLHGEDIISKTEKIIKLPKLHRTILLIHEMIMQNDLREYLDGIFDKSMTKEVSEMAQEESAQALKEIKATKATEAIQSALKDNNLEKLFNYDHSDYLTEKLSVYIKENVNDLVTSEYKEKAERFL
jgi:hypothetical protein